MIGLVFLLGAEVFEVRIVGHEVLFRTAGSPFASIEGLKLSKAGVIKEFPELKDNPEWKTIAINRFKEKVKATNNEDETKNYIIQNLAKHGFKLKYLQKAGFRPIKYK